MLGETYSPRLPVRSHHRQRQGLELSPILNAAKKLLDVGFLLAAALLAFEIFNFKATQFALADLLGGVSFVGIRWATILAIAFCAIDVAGLLWFFTLGESRGNSLEAWYLIGAWLLGATMNAFMAWWAVSVTLVNYGSTSGFLGQLSLLDTLPIVVAAMVWLTRIMFIGALSATAGYLFAPSAPSGTPSLLTR
jgi:hypothetical protein